MTQTPPTPPDPYDYAHPNPPTDTHLWDKTGLAKVLGLSPVTFTRKKSELQIPHVLKKTADPETFPGPGTMFYDLNSIIDYDKECARTRGFRLINDAGLQRRVIDHDGQAWIDGEPVYTTHDIAEQTGIPLNTVINYSRNPDRCRRFFVESKYRWLRRRRYWSQDQLDELVERYARD